MVEAVTKALRCLMPLLGLLAFCPPSTRTGWTNIFKRRWWRLSRAGSGWKST